MSVIDKQGRLFKKINLLDLVVVLAILAVAGRYGYRHFIPKQAVPQTTVNVEVRFTKVGQPNVDAVKVGDQVWDATTNVLLGTVVKKEARPFMVQGQSAEYPSKQDYDLYVTVSGLGTISDKGDVTLGGEPMRVGQAQALMTTGWKSSGFVTIIPSK